MAKTTAKQARESAIRKRAKAVADVTVTTDIAALDPDVLALFQRFATEGAHPEYRAFENRLPRFTGQIGAPINLWEFVNDAVHATGGFANGRYLYPFALEVAGGGNSSKKYRARQAIAKYHRFASRICNFAWDTILSCRTLIVRSSKVPEVSRVWGNTDGRGTDMTDFMQYPVREARKFGTAWIFVDRTSQELPNIAADRDPATDPYFYIVPTRNVPDWEFDERGNLIGVVVAKTSLKCPTIQKCPLRIWSRGGWADFEVNPSGGKGTDAYILVANGDNEIGEVPVAWLFNRTPEVGKTMGDTELLDVAHAAQDVYNVDSERREVHRKTAVILAVPAKNAQEMKDSGAALVIGTENVLLYDAEVGSPPAYIEPGLEILKELKDYRTEKIDDAYEMASLKAVSAHFETKGALHAAIEYDKTELAIGSLAANCEAAEKRLGYVVALYRGMSQDEARKAATVTYPRNFGIRDRMKLIEETELVLEMNLGETHDRKALSNLFRGLYPRETTEDIEKMVDEAIKLRQEKATQDARLAEIVALSKAAKTSARSGADQTDPSGNSGVPAPPGAAE